MSVSRILYKSFYWKVLQFLISLTTTVILARVLKSDGSAAFYSFIYLFSIILVFFSFGLDVGLTYFIAKGELSSRQAIVGILLIAMAALSVSLPCIYAFYIPVTTLFSNNEILIFTALQITGGLFSSLSGAIFTAHHDNHVATKVLIAFNIIFLSVAIVIYSTGSSSSLIYTTYAWYLLVFVQGAIMMLLSYFKYSDMPVIQHKRPVLFKKIIAFSFIVFVANSMFFIAGKLPAFILPYWVSAYEAGNYIQAYKLLEYMGTVVAFICLPIITISAKEGEEKMWCIVLLFVRLFNTATIAGGVLLLLFGKIIFPFIFGETFGIMYRAFIYLIPAFICTASSSFITAYFFGKGYLRYNLISAIVLLLVVLISLYPLTAKYGIGGAAFALSIGSFFSLLMDIFYFRRLHQCKLSDMLLIRKADINEIIPVFRKIISPRGNLPPY